MKTRFSKWLAIAVISLSSLLSAPAQVGPGTNLLFQAPADGYGSVPSSPSLSIANAITMEAWISYTGSSTFTLVDKKGVCDGVVWKFVNGVPWFEALQSCGTVLVINGSTSVPAGTWNHVAVVCNGSGVAFFLNGVLDRFYASSATLRASTVPLYFGRFSGGGGNFTGNIDELRIWNTTRTPEQIQQNMHRTVPGDAAGLAAYYRFDEGEGAEVFDLTANGNTMTLSNYGSVVQAQSTAPIDIRTLAATDITLVSATLRGEVNTKGVTAEAYFQYGTTTNFESVTSPVSLDALASLQPVVVTVPDLSSNTTYYCQLVVVSVVGGSSITNLGETVEFVMQGLPEVSVIGVAPDTTSATFFVTASPHDSSAGVYLQYGKTSAYGIVSAVKYVTNAATAYSFTITGLSPGTLYYYTFVATNSVGETNLGELTFTTYPPPPPVVTTVGTTNIAGPGATLIGSLDSGGPTTAFFEYGTTPGLEAGSVSTNIVPGTALNFAAASSQFIQVNQTAQVGTNNALTFEAWINPATMGCRTMLSQENDYIFQVGYNGATCGTTMNIGFYCAGAWHFSTGTVPTNAWTHVAVTYDGTAKQFFINGVLNTTSPRTGSVNQSGAPWQIGRQGASCNCNFFDGKLRELRMWNVVRTAGQLSASLNASLTGSEPGLLAYYPMNEGSGVKIGDASGHGNTGTLLGPTWSSPAVFRLPVTGLAAFTTYYYRAGATSAGGTSYGEIQTFSTSASVLPISLRSPMVLGNRAFRFNFTNTPGAAFTVRGTTNLGLPLSNWTVLTPVVESPAGTFQFTDTNTPVPLRRFYNVSSP